MSTVSAITITSELEYEERALNWDKNISHGKKQLEKIYKEWAYEVAARFEKEKKDLHLVCSHIKGRLRFRGASESTRDYVAECLPSDFKDPRFDGSKNRSYEKEGDGRDGKPSLYEDLDQKCMMMHYRSDIDELTLADKHEIIPRAIDLQKAKIKELREGIKNLKDAAEEFNIPIPEVEKISAEDPPEYFWGHSELWYSIGGLEEDVEKILKQIQDLKNRVYKFKPNKELAAECATKFEAFRNNNFHDFRMAVHLILKRYENILTPHTDLKWSDDMTGWFQTSNDRMTKWGNKGCGTKHAIPTGDFIEKEWEDGTVDLIGLTREKTKEQVGDKTQKQMIKLALELLLGDSLEQSLHLWATKTMLAEEVPR